MQKWEYKFVMCRFRGHWRPRLVDGEKLADWRSGPTMFEYSNQLGDEGWELVSMDLKRRRYRMVFKRPKE